MLVSTKTADKIIGISYLVFLLIFSFLIFDRRTGNSIVEIQTVKYTYIYQLVKDNRLSFQGPLGMTSVVIEDEAVSVIDSPGPLKICVKSSPIQNNGEWLACLPNRIFIRIIKQRKEESLVDAIVF